ncbi:hypothetical protein AWZ03_008746 [Drosophila navojoa]|uniref:PLC-beta PH domain-containing protein n=1 Tax=Drosophila navojoa TaxID=7232 RepID=A0A484B868_DRONA|nr:hypothetical protein AWZ03_008746 [Drosophila navojoa]
MQLPLRLYRAVDVGRGDAKLRQIVTMGPQDTLEEKTVTICHGSDFVNMTFVNFCCTRRDIAQVRSNKQRGELQRQQGEGEGGALLSFLAKLQCQQLLIMAN